MSPGCGTIRAANEGSPFRFSASFHTSTSVLYLHHVDGLPSQVGIREQPPPSRCPSSPGSVDATSCWCSPKPRRLALRPPRRCPCALTRTQSCRGAAGPELPEPSAPLPLWIPMLVGRLCSQCSTHHAHVDCPMFCLACILGQHIFQYARMYKQHDICVFTHCHMENVSFSVGNFYQCSHTMLLGQLFLNPCDL